MIVFNLKIVKIVNLNSLIFVCSSPLWMLSSLFLIWPCPSLKFLFKSILCHVKTKTLVETSKQEWPSPKQECISYYRQFFADYYLFCWPGGPTNWTNTIIQPQASQEARKSAICSHGHIFMKIPRAASVT